MIAILSALLGLVGSFAPEVIKYFNKKQDNEHEIKMLEKQVEAQKILHEQKLEEINTEADIKESIALYEAAEVTPTQVKWADALLGILNGTVRPVVTYAFVAMYLWVKIVMIYTYVWIQKLSTIQVVQQMWTEFDNSVLMLVLGFWFGGRMAQKVFKLK